MEGKTNLQKLPSRVKYYLLEWKDSNMNDYIAKHGETKLNELTIVQLYGLFSYATTKDSALHTEIELNNKYIHTKEDVIEAFSQGVSAEINFDKEYHGEYFENYYNKTFKNKQL